MKKLLKLYSLALAFGLSYSVANAQVTNNEGAARMPETEGTNIIVENEKKAVITAKENHTIVVENKVKTAKTVETNTEVIEFKNLNTTKKIVKGDRIKRHLKPEKKEQTNLSKNGKLGLIFVIVGLVFMLVLWAAGLWYLGSVLLTIGLIILLLDYLEII
ncbi:hypothetical protein AD998_16015 [bacterium 336/3]|nr:hypothetical protein AD998_16015 [bacterium 336/3]